MDKRMITRFVKNEENTERVPNIGNSWIWYWLLNSGQGLRKCPICGCNIGLVDNLITYKVEGAYIRLLEADGTWSDKVYIVPMCHKCNCQFGEELQVLDQGKNIVVVEEICRS